MTVVNCKSVNDFKKINRIGEGTYGFVYRAIEKLSGRMVALKRIIMHNEESDGFPLTSLREIKTLKRCKHQNVVKLLDVAVGKERDAVFLVLEYCEQDLAEIIKRFAKPFKESDIKQLSMQLISGIGYLHRNWIVHRDIKLSNLLYTSGGVLKLADFGLARTLSVPASDQLTQKVVTLWYRAPELLLGSELYTFAVDMWSVGCIIGELLLQAPVLPGNNEADQIHLIFKLLGVPNSRIWPEVESLPLVQSGKVNLYKLQDRYKYNNLEEIFPMLSAAGQDFLDGLLTYDPKIRMTARDALRHKYFRTSPYPQDPSFMPTFPCKHDEMV